jgi:hypothetical protein
VACFAHGDADVRAERSAAMDVRGRIGRGQAEKSCDDLYCFSRRIKYYDCGARSGRMANGRLWHHSDKPISIG